MFPNETLISVVNRRLEWVEAIAHTHIYTSDLLVGNSTDVMANQD